MKKLLNVKLFLLAVLVLGLTTINVSATTGGHRSNKDFCNLPSRNDNCSRGNNGRGNHDRTCKPTKPTVRTPIDAGLITLLIGGGIALVGVKKRKNQQN
jgi:hypothetical protein